MSSFGLIDDGLIKFIWYSHTISLSFMLFFALMMYSMLQPAAEVRCYDYSYS